MTTGRSICFLMVGVILLTHIALWYLESSYLSGLDRKQITAWSMELRFLASYIGAVGVCVLNSQLAIVILGCWYFWRGGRTDRNQQNDSSTSI